MTTDALDRYEIKRLIGRGGMGEVYEAVHRELGRRVALKTLREDFDGDSAALRRFVREAEDVASLEHENVVRIYETFENAGTRYLALEFVDGGDLAASLRARPGPWPMSVALLVLAGVASGLAEAHAVGIVHRDVKPANILITSRGCPKLTDFGLARRDRRETRVTRSGDVLGTVGFMAPEQWRGDPVGPPADVFALGVVAHRVLAGQNPFVDESAAYSVRRADFATVPLVDMVPNCPDEVASLVDRMLLVDPERRPRSSEVAETLERASMIEDAAPRTRSERERAVRDFLFGPTEVAADGSEDATVVIPPPSDHPGGQRWPRVLAALALVTAVLLVWWSSRELPVVADVGWADLRLSEPAELRGPGGERLHSAESTQFLLEFPAGSVAGLTATTAAFDAVPLPGFDVIAGDTVRLDVVHLWGTLMVHSEPGGADVVVGDDTRTTPDGFYLARGEHTMRVRSPAGPLSVVNIVRDGAVETIPFQAMEPEGTYEFRITLHGADDLVLGMVFDE